MLTSNVFAILGLRAMYFLLAAVAAKFHLLSYGLAVILAFIGTKMLLMSASKVGSRIPQHGRAIDAAVAAGIRHLVYTSYVGKDGDNPSLAVSDHRGTERLLRESGVGYTVLRNSQYIEAVVEAQAPHALRTGRWIASAAEGRMAQVSRDDCVASAVAVLATALTL